MTPVFIGGDTGAEIRYQALLAGSSSSGRQALSSVLRAWEKTHGSCQLPATPRQVQEFVRSIAAQGLSGSPLKPQTIRLLLQHLSRLHVQVLQVTDPTSHLLVTSEMRALYRERGSRARPIMPLRLKGDVANILADEPLPGSVIQMLRALQDDRTGWALRARVVLGLGADTGRDRSDYVRMNVGDAVASGNGDGHALFARRSSGQEIGEAPKFISPDTMGFIREWLGWREKAAPGSTAASAPLLVRIDQKGMPGGRLSIWGYVDVLKDIMRRVGGGAHVSGNSFQAGLKLDLAAIGTTKVGIANALGFREL